MKIKRPKYINWLLTKQNNGRIKVLTGLRGSGKTYLLNNLYRQQLNNRGIDNDHILYLDLENVSDQSLLYPLKLYDYVRSCIQDQKPYVLFIDEIESLYSIHDPALTNGKIKRSPKYSYGTFWYPEMLRDFLSIPNLDTCITSSNSYNLGLWLCSEHRERPDHLRVLPLSLEELHNAFPHRTAESVLDEYLHFGGLPAVWNLHTIEKKQAYLKSMIETVYLKDVTRFTKIRKYDRLPAFLQAMAGFTGKPFSPSLFQKSFSDILKENTSPDLTDRWINCLLYNELICYVRCLDLKTHRQKTKQDRYYFTDPGLYQAALDFRQEDFQTLLENTIYLTLLFHDHEIISGSVPICKGRVDFICNYQKNQFYVQTAFDMENEDFRQHKVQPLLAIQDDFPKCVITKDRSSSHDEENGIIYCSLSQLFD